VLTGSSVTTSQRGGSDRVGIDAIGLTWLSPFIKLGIIMA